MSILNDKEIPVGLGMALAQNLDAMKVFASLSESERDSVIARSHRVMSKQDMAGLIDSLLK